MPLLMAKLTVACPESGKEVNVKKECVTCKHYEYTGYKGLTPYVSCNYE